MALEMRERRREGERERERKQLWYSQDRFRNLMNPFLLTFYVSD